LNAAVIEFERSCDEGVGDEGAAHALWAQSVIWTSVILVRFWMPVTLIREYHIFVHLYDVKIVFIRQGLTVNPEVFYQSRCAQGERKLEREGERLREGERV
jgi:hypothetical protein